MKKTIKYSGIEKITYRFSKEEIEKALVYSHDIDLKSAKREFYIIEGDEEEEGYAVLIVKKETPQES